MIPILRCRATSVLTWEYAVAEQNFQQYGRIGDPHFPGSNDTPLENLRFSHFAQQMGAEARRWPADFVPTSDFLQGPNPRNPCSALLYLDRARSSPWLQRHPTRNFAPGLIFKFLPPVPTIPNNKARGKLNPFFFPTAVS